VLLLLCYQVLLPLLHTLIYILDEGIIYRDVTHTRVLLLLCCQVLLPLLQTLIYIHAEGIIHRDVKPEHVLLNSEKVAKLSGFFLAQVKGFEMANVYVAELACRDVGARLSGLVLHKRRIKMANMFLNII
jgi:serine/threonine protein kinase